MFRIAIVFLVFAGAAVSDDFNNLNVPPDCKTALEDTFHNPNVTTCLNAVGLEEIINLTANTSIVSSVSQFVWPFCAGTPCDADILTAAESNISTACANDINSDVTDVALLGVNYVLEFALQEFDASRSVVCLEDTSNKTNCVVELLTNLETQLGEPLSLDGFGMLFKDLLHGNLPQVNVTELACSPCAQALFAIVQPALGPASGLLVKELLETECGGAFVSTSPTGVPEVTGTAAQALISSNAASGRIKVFGMPTKGVVGAAAVMAGLFSGIVLVF